MFAVINMADIPDCTQSGNNASSRIMAVGAKLTEKWALNHEAEKQREIRFDEVC